jgi:diguanylate cyclase (GGDEF)-like protein
MAGGADMKGWFFLAGLFAGLACLGGHWFYALIPSAGSLVLAVTAGPKRSRVKDKVTGAIPTVGHLPEPPQTGKTPEPRYDTKSFLKSDLAAAVAAAGAPDPARNEAQSREARRQGLRELEDALDASILEGLALLKQAVPGGHTYAVFFPGKSEGLYLRAWITDSGSLIAGASLSSNQGLAGQLLKEGVKRVLEGDIVADSTLLHYYAADDRVRSLAGVPILVKGARRGAIIIDSLNANAFDAAVVERLEGLANILGQLAFSAYLAFEQAFQKEQLVSLTTYQRKFLENMSVENIVTQAEKYMVECLEGDRFTVVGRLDGGDQAKVISCSGRGADGLAGFEFALSEKGVLALAFEKEQVINRIFTGPPVPRLSPREKMPTAMASLLAVPVPTDQGVDMAFMVESEKPRRFTDHQQNMLSTIARAAGFALSRARLYQEKEKLASRDGLTGIENHRTFQERFQGEILRAQRYDQQLAVLMMDIDFFKKVNDTYGHPVGDVVLKEVARIISQNIRAGVDLLARYGGEEFVCMLADSDRERAGETAERIRTSVADKQFESGGVRFQVTMSIGGAMYPVDSKHGREVLEKADKALYHAKETGRNRLVFYN